MKDHVRDTVFGHAVRLLSRNQLLQFPDEVDPTLWKQCIHREPIGTPSTSEGQDNSAEAGATASTPPSHDVEKAAEDDHEEASAERSLQQNLNLGHEKPDGVILVDWYGPDDPEV